VTVCIGSPWGCDWPPDESPDPTMVGTGASAAAPGDACEKERHRKREQIREKHQPREAARHAPEIWNGDLPDAEILLNAIIFERIDSQKIAFPRDHELYFRSRVRKRATHVRDLRAVRFARGYPGIRNVYDPHDK